MGIYVGTAEGGYAEMRFTYRVYYRDDSRWNYGKLRCKLVHARSKQQAMDKFYQRFGIRPLRAE